MVGRFISFILVVVQFLCILLLILLSYKLIFFTFATFFVYSGLMLGGWAIWVMRKSKLRITPGVAKKAKLITAGPYKYIRHPMYAAVLLFCLGLVCTNIHIDNFIIYVLLVIDLLFKINYEEKILTKHFSKYNKYQKKTKRLIPKLY